MELHDLVINHVVPLVENWANTPGKQFTALDVTQELERTGIHGYPHDSIKCAVHGIMSQLTNGKTLVKFPGGSAWQYTGGATASRYPTYSFTTYPVSSSFVKEIAYDENLEVLRVTLDDNGSTRVYLYADVPSTKVLEMLGVNASGRSVGRFYNSDIKGRYDTI